MNGDSKQIQAIQETERRFWRLISSTETEGGAVCYEPEDKITLREAKKIVADSLEGLKDAIIKHRPDLLRLSPQFELQNSGGSLRRLSGDELLSLFEDTVYRPYGEACLYLWADELKNLPVKCPRGIEVVQSDGEKGRGDVLSLRDEKDQEISNETVRASLRTWVLRRMEEIPGYTTLLLREFDTPIGMLSFYRESDTNPNVTRVRDLFISPAYQGRGYAKLLFKHLADVAKAPYAVVTDLDNTALFQYRQRGFRAVFAQEAYQLVAPGRVKGNAS